MNVDAPQLAAAPVLTVSHPTARFDIWLQERSEPWPPQDMTHVGALAKHEPGNVNVIDVVLAVPMVRFPRWQLAPEPTVIAPPPLTLGKEPPLTSNAPWVETTTEALAVVTTNLLPEDVTLDPM